MGVRGEWEGRESDKISRIFCGHVNFAEMNWGISLYGGQSRIIIKGGGGGGGVCEKKKKKKKKKF